MKLCIIGPVFPYRGGIAHYNALLLRELARVHEVSAISFKRLYPKPFFPGKNQFETGRKALHFPAKRIIDSLSPISWWQTGRYVAEQSPDLVLFHWWQPVLAPCFAGIAGSIRRHCRTRILTLCHNTISHERRWFDPTLAHLAFLQTDGFIAHSQKNKEELRALRPKTPVVVASHPSYQFFSILQRSDRERARRTLGISPKDRIFLFFGFVRAYKGVEILLTAMPTVFERTGAQLWIVGEWWKGNRERLSQQIERLKALGAIKIVDRYIPNEQISNYFNACDAVVLPYRAATQSGVIQMAHGFLKPVISTRIDGVHEVIQHGKTGFLVPPEEKDPLIEAMVSFFENERGKQCCEFLKSHFVQRGWDTLAGKITSFDFDARQGAPVAPRAESLESPSMRCPQ